MTPGRRSVATDRMGVGIDALQWVGSLPDGPEGIERREDDDGVRLVASLHQATVEIGCQGQMCGQSKPVYLRSLICKSLKIPERYAVLCSPFPCQLPMAEEIVQVCHDDYVISRLAVWRHAVVGEHRIWPGVIGCQRERQILKFTEEMREHARSDVDVCLRVPWTVQDLHQSACV